MVRAAFSFRGRSRRFGFGLSVLLFVACQWTIGLLNFGKLPEWYWVFVALPLMWLYLSQGVRRCHDLGKPWWYFIIPFYVFWMLFVEGQKGPNRYGTDPREQIV